jgi:acyl-CoA thioester hydrolase
MFKHETEIRVRYAETDKMGYTYYGNYATYLEVARVEALRELGIRYKDMEDMHDVLLPVAKYESNFIRPAYYDSKLTLRTEIREIPSSFISFHTDIFNEGNKIINRSVVKLAFIKSDGSRIDAPSFIIEALGAYFKNQ